MTVPDSVGPAGLASYRVSPRSRRQLLVQSGSTSCNSGLLAGRQSDVTHARIGVRSAIPLSAVSQLATVKEDWARHSAIVT